ncbi:MAG TPA: integrase [Lachnospiraceae bacterium]|nr:integrase [Lachnospiraceae bacterium]
MQKIRISSKKNEVKSIQEGILEFQKNCNARNLSPYTMKYYSGLFHIMELFTSLDETAINDIDEDYVYDFINFLKDSRNVADTTVVSYLKGLKTLLYFFMRKEYVDKFHIYIPSADKPLKDVYTLAELQLLLKKPNTKKCSFPTYRSWAMIVYFIGTGQRLRTVLNIKLKDVDLENNLVKLTAVKNRKQTILPLSSQVVEAINEYLKFRDGKEDDYLFCKWDGLQLTKRGAEEGITRYNISRGVEKTSIHAFRHTFAKNYLMSGGDVFRLQKLMCHSDIAVTKEYLNLTVDDLSVNLDSLTPLKDISNKKIKLKK